jgi:hypothetical protein
MNGATQASGPGNNEVVAGGFADETRRYACLDFDGLVCHAVRCVDLALWVHERVTARRSGTAPPPSETARCPSPSPVGWSIPVWRWTHFPAGEQRPAQIVRASGCRWLVSIRSASACSRAFPISSSSTSAGVTVPRNGRLPACRGFVRPWATYPAVGGMLEGVELASARQRDRSSNCRDQPPLLGIRLVGFPVVTRTDGIGDLRFPRGSIAGGSGDARVSRLCHRSRWPH